MLFCQFQFCQLQCLHQIVLLILHGGLQDYQRFSGTRSVVLDLAETPSNLFEYFAWDYRVLRTFARHYSTGEIIPEKSVESMQGAKKMFAATELQLQVYTSNVINQQAFEI
ncbi:hypothetical protein I3760_03G101800 [Carya illinoinensis]|uniref:mitochondrial intermediate peptidase, mitochondrial-like isoform X4 n=1 Tax=Carya illinoinensis TaxID=32201 RepID=UPI001BF39399|nr:mitochondrial intermediate peptidase, mitochondrial-like isoform X4 [Carya illinoinensis]KAG2715926.1 hypothetical protein I3760_03G101800 [Carya illinoinensis]